MQNTFVENLGADKYGNPSSLDYHAKRSKFARFRKSETCGKWKIVAGYSFYTTSSVKAAHGSWAYGLLKLGFRIGSIDGNYAIFIPNEKA